MRNIPKAGTPSEADTGAQAATQARLATKQAIVLLKDDLRNVKSRLDFPGTSEAQKKHLRQEYARLTAAKAALEGGVSAVGAAEWDVAG